MPRKRTNELIQCRYFRWLLQQRGKMYQADGRSNELDAGRHSLGTHDRAEALQKLQELDANMAVEFKLAPPSAMPTFKAELVLLEVGRKLYEEHSRRPRAIGGVKKSTQKRNRAVFNKFLDWAKDRRLRAWNDVTGSTLTAYATHLDDQGYAPKTIRIELTTIVQAHKWLREEKHLQDVEPLKLTIRKQESERRYCYRIEEVQAMVAFCRKHADLAWLVGVIVGLACTGLRISELASLRWSDVDLTSNFIKLVDEGGQPKKSSRANRELKSGRSRMLPIHPDLGAVLRSLAKQDQFLFHGPRGGRLKPDTVRNVLIREVIKPLEPKFSSPEDEQGFKDGRLHSFRHYFVSMCANNNIPERVTMEWLGHQDSEMVRHYYHLHDEEARRQMARLDPLGSAGKQLPGNGNGAANKIQEAPPSPERTDEKSLVTT
ncbi:MAG: tyrosine-type recombinase/integrase [Planctomycetaceae bacterium]|nr:tyrosine-type recombinase/integrase [Planctomycetaceae bacterium]